MPKQNLKTASKKAVHQSNVAKLDDLGTEKEDVDLGILNVIEQLSGDFILRVIDNINKIKDFVVTGAITDITLEPTKHGLNIVAPKHLVYQSRGVSGTERKYDTPHSYTDKMPPGPVFEDWINRKKLNLRDNEKYSGKKTPFKELSQADQINRISWSIARNIYRNGIEPKNLYEKEIPKLIDDIQKEIADFAVQHITQQIAITPKHGGENRIIIK
jgi:hypothetical protein